MINIVVLTGRLTADPELKYTTSNIPVTSFTIAVERKYKQGEERQTDFINIVVWRQTAEFVSKYFSKGSLIGIEGTIQTRKYEDKDGKNRTVFEVVANNVHFIEGKKTEKTETEKTENEAPDKLKQFAEDNADFVNVTDDGDLPF